MAVAAYKDLMKSGLMDRPSKLGRLSRSGYLSRIMIEAT